MNKVVEFLMKRDNISEEVAIGVVNEVRDMLRSAVAYGEGFEEIGSIIVNELELEIDDIFELI